MNESYLVVAGRIRQELEDLDRVVRRVERAATAAQQRPEDRELYFDAAALNLHDFYAGLERIFHHIATTIDKNLPSGPEWHRDLLQQMRMPLFQIRPRVLSAETVQALDEFLRFRHVVRNIYAFEFDPERIERLVYRLRPCFDGVRGELLDFADLLEQCAQDA